MRSGQILQFPLRLGLAEDANPKAPPVSALKTGANVRWPKDGQLGKRLGTETVTANVHGGGTLSGLERFIVRGRELSVTDGETLYTLNETEDEWFPTENVSELDLSWSTLIDDATSVATADVALSGNLIVQAWVTGDPTAIPEAAGFSYVAGRGECFVQVIDRQTQQILMAPVLMSHSLGAIIMHVRVLLAGGYAFVIYSTTDDKIRCMPVDLSTFTVGTVADLIDDLESSTSLRGRFDAIFRANGDLVIVFERDLGASSSLAAFRFTRAGSVFTEVASEDLSEDSIKSISIAEDATAGRIGILYCHADADPLHRVRFTTIDSGGLAAVVSPTTLHDDFFAWQCELYLVATGTFGVVYAGIDQAGADDFPVLRSFELSNLGAVDTDSVQRSTAMALLSKSFTVGSRRYVFASDARYGERAIASGAELVFVPAVSSYVLEIENPDYSVVTPPHRMVGKIDHDVASMVTMGLLPQVAAVSSRTVYGLVPFQASAAPASFNWRSGLKLVRVTVDGDLRGDAWRSVSIGQEAYIAGARLSAWDGRTVFDHGMRTPFVIQVSEGSANTGNKGAGAYVYGFCATFRSRAGVLHRGPMSISYETTTAANGITTILLAPNAIDGKQSVAIGFGTEAPGQAYIEAYRTEANGSVLYKLTHEPSYGIIQNEATANTVTFIDSKPDSDITLEPTAQDPPVPAVALSERPQPYTATGELEDVQPPAQYTLHYHNNRIGLITGGRREYWPSKDLRENPGIAPGFNPAQVELYDEDLVGSASLDEKRIMFSERRIWFVVGDGPTVAGTDNRFSPPQAIQSDVGCTNPRSIVSWPGGVIFQNGVELYNLDRGLQVVWIGKDARDTLATFSEITSAVLVPAENEIRFTCNGAVQTYDPETGGYSEGDPEGRIVVYDYQRNTWTVRAYPGADPIVDATLCDGDYYFATEDTVRRELTTVHTDDGDFAPSTVKLAPLSPAGPISWHRVRRAQVLGTSVSNHQLTIAIARDWSANTQQTVTFAAGSDTTTVGPRELAEVHLSVQKVQAVEIHISDAAPANANAYPVGNGGGFTLDGVALLVEPKRGLPRITPSRRG